MDDDELFERIENYPIEEKINSLLVLPYVDHEAGLSFQTVAACLLEDDELLVYERGDNFENLSNSRFGAVKDFEFEYLENLMIPSDFDIEPFTSRAMEIFKLYNDDEKILVLRALPLLDDVRDKEFPDDILVIFLKEGFGAEGMWVRYEDYDEEHDIIGRLLNQPNQDLGINTGDMIKFSFTKDENEKIVCYCILDK